jgi:hypothetical protein
MDTRRSPAGQQPTESHKPETRVARWKAEAVEATCRVLARSGNYSEAERRLRDWMRSYGPTAPLVDLLARVTVQQGKLDEARHLWQAATKLDPGNPIHRVALRKLNSFENRSERPPLVSPAATVVIFALAAIIVALVVFIAYSHMHKHHPKTKAASIQSALPTQLDMASLVP